MGKKLGKILKNAQFYSEKWPRKTATKTWLFLLYFWFLLLNFFVFFPLFLLISCCFMLSWNPKTAHQVRLQAFLFERIFMEASLVFPRLLLRICVNFSGTRRVQKSMGHKCTWKIGMLICHPVTSRPLIFLQKEAILSPCNFATTHLTACILKFISHEMEAPFAMPQLP